MNLSQIIMTEHSKAQAVMIADLVVQKPELFTELLEIIFANKNTLSQRAAWPLRFILERNEKLVLHHLPKMINQLPHVESVAVQRNLLFILANVKIPERYHGELLDYTSKILLNSGSSVASIIYSVDIFFNISKNEPFLLNELKLMIELLIPNGTPGIKSKCNHTLKKIAKAVRNK